jgi:hypothetical protein
MAEMSYTDNDVGKHVVNADGDRAGTVTAVRHGTAYVDPNPDLFDRIKAKLGWKDADEDTYPLQESEVSEITDDEIGSADSERATVRPALPRFVSPPAGTWWPAPTGASPSRRSPTDPGKRERQSRLPRRGIGACHRKPLS